MLPIRYQFADVFMVASMAAVEEHNLAENDSLLSNKELAVNLRSDGEDEGADTETSEKEAVCYIIF